MKPVIEITKVLGYVNAPEGERELCATADAQYDEPRSRLVVRLDSFLRTTDFTVREQKLKAPWLPKPDITIETVSLEESMDLAREIFHGWVRKVQSGAPALHLQPC